MKKVMLFIILVLFTIGIVSCTTADTVVDDPHKTIENETVDKESIRDIEEDTETNQPEIPLGDDTSYDESANIQEEPIPPTVSEITELSLRDITIELQDTQIIDASTLYYTEALGSRKTYENMLPQIIGFEYPYVYYERMSALVKGAEPNAPALYVGRYSIETKEKYEFAIDSFSAISSEARLIVNDDCVVYMYFLNGRMVSELYNFADGTRKILDDTQAHNVFGYPKKLSENEIVMFMYESTPNGAQQKITRYNISSGELIEIYRGEIMGGYKDSQTSTKDIFAIDTYNGEIYLLMHQYSENRMHSFIKKLDKEGNILSEEKLDALNQYNTLEDTADSLVIMGDYAIVHFMRINRSENNMNPLSAVLYHAYDGYKLFDVGEKIELNTYCGIGSDELPMAFFAIHNDVDTIFACDTQTNEGISLHINGVGVVTTVVDSDGKLLIATRNDEKTNWYIVTPEHYLD